MFLRKVCQVTAADTLRNPCAKNRYMNLKIDEQFGGNK